VSDSLDAYLVLSGILFSIGTFGFLARRNAISMLMSIELMLNGVNLAIIAFGAFVQSLQGASSVIALIVMAVAAAEASTWGRLKSPVDEGLKELGKVVDEAAERFRKTGTGDR